MGNKIFRIAMPLVALGLLAWGHYTGLFIAPPDREMGDVQRIMYVHVPAVWITLVALTINFICCVTYLLKSDEKTFAMWPTTLKGGIGAGLVGALVSGARYWSKSRAGLLVTDEQISAAITEVLVVIFLFTALGALTGFIWSLTKLKTDSLAEASAEVGLMFGTVGVLLGAIWGRPTWGVYWTWDPRLTTAAIMLVAYMGYMAMRRFVEDPEKRAVWSAVVGIIAAVDLPIIWFSVKWWRSLHQVQSTPKTVDPAMVLPLRISAFAFLAFMILFIVHRYRIALAERQEEVALPESLPTDAPQARRPQEVT